MIEFNSDKKMIRICIPVTNLRDVNRYHKSIINVLDRIEISDCNPEFRNDLINVYELLSHLVPDKEFLNQEGEGTTELESNENLRKMLP
jgi:hypothetical protein